MVYESTNTFYAHPKEDGAPDLLNHCLKVAKSAKKLVSDTRLKVGNVSFYAGLLHDLGKLNPYYQMFFTFNPDPALRYDLKDRLQREYVRGHSLLSALAAYWLLINNSSIDEKQLSQILFTVAGHHSQLLQLYQTIYNLKSGGTYPAAFNKSRLEMLENLKLFIHAAKKVEVLNSLDWNGCIDNFKYDPDLARYCPQFDPTLEYIEFCSVFSALLMADRGSFYTWEEPVFDIGLNTQLMTKSGKLSELRESFQKWVLSNNDLHEQMMILEAPTGIGKTKMFLDMIGELIQKNSIKRVFYFSPLLALTDDFENKLFEKSASKDQTVIGEKDLDDVMVYNHTFTGTLHKKIKQPTEEDYKDEEVIFSKTPEYFKIESFNKKFILTTTQRLFITLYSNKCSDKMKFLSFKDSLLIIDEVQTVPKFILPNFIRLLKLIAEKLNTKILLVSATVPHQIRRSVPILKYPPEIMERYLRATKKNVCLQPSLGYEEVKANEHERVLVMLNTRNKARKFYESVASAESGKLYLSSGIRKRDRRLAIKKLRNQDQVTVISTQVMEAGVDVSFARMYRELAPLDNVIQAMGRLNREAEASTPSTLVVFCTDGKCEPYSYLEFRESYSILKAVKDSEQLYSMLPDYYKKIDESNQQNRDLARVLDNAMKNLDFEGVWSFIRDKVLPKDSGSSVLIPDDVGTWEDIKYYFSRTEGRRNESVMRKYADLTADLPGDPEKMGIIDLFDKEILEFGILLPKRDSIPEIYDAKLGLDKWLK